MERRRVPVHRTILVVDVQGFGDRRRTNPHQLAVRDGLYQALKQAFRAAAIPWEGCQPEDRGDGVLFLAPAEVPKSGFAEVLPEALAEGLRAHNDGHRAEEQIRLRMALHAGEVSYDDHGVTGAAINLAFRLVDAGPLKEALAGSPGLLAGLFLMTSW
jgi:class 3 adenylate cyclase